MHRHDGHHFFAIRLTRAASLRAMGWDADAYRDHYRTRMIELARWLVNPGDERLAYELRLISHPEPEQFTGGRIDVVLLCRLTGLADDEAAVLADITLRKLAADFEEYEFAAVPDDEVAALLRPFEPRHVTRIRRRLSRESLDTLRPGARFGRNRRIGFSAAAVPASEPDTEPATILHTFEFRPGYGPAGPLFQLLLRAPHPMAVGFRLHPTHLDPAEAGFLESQIHACERAVQFRVHSAGDPGFLAPTLSEQARMFQTCLQMNLNGLRDDAAVVTISLASPAPIPDPIVDTVGSFVTGPAGGLGPDSDPFQHLSGGYDADEGGDDDRAAFTTLGTMAPELPGCPEAGRLPYLFDAVGASTAFRLPPLSMDPLPGMASRDWRLLLPPAGWPAEGVALGRTRATGIDQRIGLAPGDRFLHTYVVGRTGTGKTTLLESMVLDDLRRGEGLLLFDPHGDLFNRLLGKIPEHRTDDVILIDPNDADFPVGLNVLEWATPDERDRLVGQVQAAVSRLMTDEYGRWGFETMGPVFMDYLDLGLRLVTSRRDDPGTFLELYNLFLEKGFHKRWLPLGPDDPTFKRRVEEFAEKFDPGRVTEAMPIGVYFRSKLAEVVASSAIRNILGQKRSTIDFHRAIDEHKVILVNLGVGETARNPLSPRHGRVLGMLLLGRLYAAAKERPLSQRKPFHVYVDEFQSLATETFVDMLSELRKFRVSLVLANQFVSQIKDERIVQAIFGNVGTMVVFPVGLGDAPLLEPEMAPLSRGDLTNLPVWHAYVRAPGRAPTPFTISSILDLTPNDPERARAVRASSRERHGRPVAEVEAEIAGSLADDRRGGR
jgi:hypothetical protein